MLTYRQVLLCYEEGIALHFSQMHNPEGAVCTFSNCAQKGSYSFPDAHIFLPHIQSTDDLGLTVIHELIHARDELVLRFQRARGLLSEGDLECLVECEAIDTHVKSPEIVPFIEEVYDVILSGLKWKKCKNFLYLLDKNELR